MYTEAIAHHLMESPMGCDKLQPIRRLDGQRVYYFAPHQRNITPFMQDQGLREHLLQQPCGYYLCHRGLTSQRVFQPGSNQYAVNPCVNISSLPLHSHLDNRCMVHSHQSLRIRFCDQLAVSPLCSCLTMVKYSNE
jgi:hypothetical protein